MAVDPGDDPPVSLESQRNRDAKHTIATAAVELITENSTIFLEASSTVRSLTPLIRRIPGLTVVTNSPEIGLDLMRGTAEVILIGGALRQRTRATVGPMAVASLRSISVETAFVGVSAISAEGLSSMNLSEAETKSAIMDSAETSIGLADSSKLGKRGLTQVSDLGRLSLLITDTDADPQEILQLENHGLQVRLAGDHRR